MRKLISGIIVGTAVFAASCNSLDKIVKSNDLNMKLTTANEYYDKGKWYRAKEIYNSLLIPLKGTRNYEELLYRYATCYYKMEDYMSASYQFKNYLDNYSSSSREDEVSFIYAQCLYNLSYKPSLDQTGTLKTIQALQSFISTHPHSQYLTLGNQYLDICQAKLEKKDAAACKLYFDIGQYKAAAASYSYLLQQYPDSKQADEYQWMIMKAQYNYAKASFIDRQEERYNAVLDNFKPFDNYYKNSPYYTDASKLAQAAENNIKELRAAEEKAKAKAAIKEKQKEDEQQQQ